MKGKLKYQKDQINKDDPLLTRTRSTTVDTFLEVLYFEFDPDDPDFAFMIIKYYHLIKKKHYSSFVRVFICGDNKILMSFNLEDSPKQSHWCFYSFFGTKHSDGKSVGWFNISFNKLKNAEQIESMDIQALINLLVNRKSSKFPNLRFPEGKFTLTQWKKNCGQIGSTRNSITRNLFN